jgi:hypothetical protein
MDKGYGGYSDVYNMSLVREVLNKMVGEWRYKELNAEPYNGWIIKY